MGSLIFLKIKEMNKEMWRKLLSKLIPSNDK